MNYTWSKALGVAGAIGNGFPSDPFDLRHNYGPELFDRRHIANATYTFILGKPVRNRFVRQFANGWEVSGITNFQTGANIPSLVSNPGLSLNGSIGLRNLADGTTNPNFITINSKTYLGTPGVSLQPTTLCSPTATGKAWGITWWGSHDIDHANRSFGTYEYELGLIDQNNRPKPLGKKFSQLVTELRRTPQSVAPRSTALVISEFGLSTQPWPPDWKFAGPYMKLVRAAQFPPSCWRPAPMTMLI